jgi:hypothetical protein
MYIYIKLPCYNQSNPSFQPLNRQKYSVQNLAIQTGCNTSFQPLNSQKYSVQNLAVQTGCNRSLNTFSGHFSRLENE